MNLKTPIKFFKTQSALRSWFKKNHVTIKELWIGLYMKDSGKKRLTYAQALEEALCFGWIDGIKKSVDEINEFKKSAFEAIYPGFFDRGKRRGEQALGAPSLCLSKINR